MARNPRPAKTGQKQSTRFQTGQSGNPSGRPAGSRNRVTLVLEKLIDDEAEQIFRVLIDKAKSGSISALEVVTPMLLPARKHRSRPAIDLGTLTTVADAISASSKIFALQAAGEIDDDAADSLARTLDRFAGLQKVELLERQLSTMAEQIEALQARAGITGKASGPAPGMSPGRIAMTHSAGGSA